MDVLRCVILAVRAVNGFSLRLLFTCRSSFSVLMCNFYISALVVVLIE